MGRIRGFILAEFGRNYLLVFLPFFSILSIVYLIRISIFSQKVTLHTEEVLRLFSFFLPDILFYTLPLSFVVALTVTMVKLSGENELIALFSFGFKPLHILKTFLLPALLFTLLMLILSLYTIPRSSLAYKLFEHRKMVEAELSISPKQLGQKFGNYIVFLEEKQEDIYRNIVLFATDNRDKRVLLSADRGTIEHNGSQVSLNLYNGTGDTFLPERIETLEYRQMILYNHARSHMDYQWLSRGWSHIQTNKRDMAHFVYYLFLSLSPLLVTGMILAFAIIHPRYQKPRTYLINFAIGTLLYGTASLLRGSGTPLMLLVCVLLFLTAGTLLFMRRTKAHF